MKVKTLLLTGLITCTTAEAQTPVYLDSTQPIEVRIDDALARMTLEEKIAVIHAQSKFSAAGVKRLGFPDFWTSDGPHGVRPEVLWDEWLQAGQTNDSCVAFPALTCLSATWNPSLSFVYGHSLGEEARYRNKDMILGPGVNIYRTPLGGRNFEYMGEDPFLTSTMVVPYIQGVQQTGVATCVKHYALNNDEEYRHQVNVNISDRALHEIYLPAFKAAITEGKAWGIMGAYNLYKDQHNCHNQTLLNDILKKDWQFDGVVVSDWGGAHDMDQSIHNGLDMEFGTWTDGLMMGATNAYDIYHLSKGYEKAIREGKYTTRELDEKVRRVLRLHYRTTMAEKRALGFMCSEAHYDAARKIAQEGIVLLQNKGNLLPLNLGNMKKVLIVGENAIKPMTVGGGSSSLKAQQELSPLEGMKRRLTGTGVEVQYERGYVGHVLSEYDGVKLNVDISDSRSAQQLIDDAVNAAKDADCVIIFGGLNKADYQDCEGHDRKSYDLPYDQDKLILALAATNKNVVFVNISGNAVQMPWTAKVPAIVQGWFLGSEAGNALADILTGDVNPSGKLPFTWPKSLTDVGAHSFGEEAFPGIWREDHKIIDEYYKEGIYVGYRWADKMKTKPTFAFGHGLSYTTFKLSDLRLSSKEMTRDGQITCTVNVKNTGSRDGAETVQLYINDKESSVDRPVKELKGFQKVFLKAGQSADVTITIDASDLSFWDEATNGWKAENGTFTALIGNASDNITLREEFKLK